MPIDLIQTVRELLIQRGAFHSEADLKHAIASELRASIADLDIRPEFPIRGATRDKHLDLFILDKRTGIRCGIELKYKTKAASFVVGTESFNLKSHGASDVNCYSFVKDIRRLEQLIADRIIDEGYAAFLTNHSIYRRDSQRETNASDFRIHQGRRLHGSLTWGPNTGGTKKGREDDLELANAYTLNWIEMNQGSKDELCFHCLVVHVEN